MMKMGVSGISFQGHQPEWGPEAKDLCGPGALPKHQHCLLGKNMNFNFIYSLISPSGQVGL